MQSPSTLSSLSSLGKLIATTACLCFFSTLGAKTIYSATTTIQITVDARDLPRQLIHSTIATVAAPAYIFPKWIPGIHGPKGPVQNLGGLYFYDSKNKAIAWERDFSEVYRFILQESVNGRISIKSDYICSQPSTNSRGVDSYGFENLGIINWNTVLLYPEGFAVQDIAVDLTLILPPNWNHGSALRVESTRGDTVTFKRTNLETLIDSPLLCGENFRTVKLVTTDLASYFVHLVADDQGDLPKDDSAFIPLRRMVTEAEKIFGGVHFEEYHLLLGLTDKVGTLGLEHRESSLNTLSSDALRDNDWVGERIQYLLTHEFAHAWCGKYRRPEGMHTEDYLTDKNNNMLWVYEGLTQYLGNVLSVRCGYATTEEFVETIASYIGGAIHQKGRQWRSVHDTEHSSSLLRGGSRNWPLLRRSQDYYREGAMLFMEFDARIRTMTEGEKSLDDFCATFFIKGDAANHAVPFSRSEVVRTLNEQVAFNWDSLIQLRIYDTQERFDPELALQCGYRLEYRDTQSERAKRRQKRSGGVSLYESLGFSCSKRGIVGTIVPESPAAKAGINKGTEIIGIAGKKFSVKRLKDAVRNTVMTGSVNLLVADGDTFKDITIEYDGGLRFYTLTRIDSATDWIAEIAASRAERSKEQLKQNE
ncbi:hypothetical protein JYT16_01515 [Gemmatimonas aurantiaca]|nr:hypothetical protein [Gemmatimonas aurantiaca]